ncbi:MAG: cupin domain-containing protein [Solirubrobacterales bacterium]
MRARTRRTAAIALVALAVPAAAAGGYAVAAGQPVREDLGAAKDPAGAQGRTLGLTRVTIPAGVSLAPHTHPGVQVSRIVRGTLTYTVDRRGSVPVYRGDAASARRLRTLHPGQTARLRAGDWIVEPQGMVHHAANQGTSRVVILLSSLYRTGAPASSPATVER